MKISDYYFTEEPNFTNRYYHAKFLSPYDIYSESKFGYLDGSEICLEGNKSIGELKALLEASNGSDEYTKAFKQAIKDFIKERGATNEY